MSEDLVREGEVLAGRYRVGRRLGEGLFGPVFGAEDLVRKDAGLDGAVAIKVVEPALVERVGGITAIAPALALACRFNHPNLVNVFDFHEDREAGLTVVVMERLEGRRLADVVQDREGSGADGTKGIVRQLIEGLAYTSQHCSFLRLNPSKVWIRDDGRVKIADLGLAMVMGWTLAKNYAIETGRGVYLAPETIGGAAGNDGRADQYSFAVMVVELVTGATALRRDAILGEAGADFPARWGDGLVRMLAADPSERFGDLSEAAGMFREGAAASEPRWFAVADRCRRVALRGRWLIAGGVVVGCLFVAGEFGLLSTTDEEAELRRRFARSQSEFETVLRGIDDLKLELYAEGLGNERFDEGIRRYMNSRGDYSLIRELERVALAYETGRGDGFESLGAVESMRGALEGRRVEVEQALSALRAMRALEEVNAQGKALVGRLPSFGGADSDVGGGFVTACEKRLDESSDAFLEGLFAEAFEIATDGLKAFRTRVTHDLTAMRAAAVDAERRWRETLKLRGVPVTIEPVGDPGQQLEVGGQAFAAEGWGVAADAFRGCLANFQQWVSELEAVPPLEDGAWENSIGMRFREVDGLDFSIWETRVIDFLVFLEETGTDPSRQWREFALETGQGPCHPVAFVNYNEAMRFCEWLTRRERAMGRIGDDGGYRLPTDREWSRAVGLPYEIGETPMDRSFEHPGTYPWGEAPVRKAELGNYDTFPNRDRHVQFVEEQDEFRWTSPVGSFGANRFGLFDLGGNVYEWVSDRLDSPDDPAAREQYRGGPDWDKVTRGGSWRTLSLESRRSAYRQLQRYGNEDTGFRIVFEWTGDGENVGLEGGGGEGE